MLILLMEEILHHLGCVKPCKSWDKLQISTGAWFLPSTVWWCCGDSWNSGEVFVETAGVFFYPKRYLYQQPCFSRGHIGTVGSDMYINTLYVCYIYEAILACKIIWYMYYFQIYTIIIICVLMIWYHFLRPSIYWTEHRIDSNKCNGSLKESLLTNMIWWYTDLHRTMYEDYAPPLYTSNDSYISPRTSGTSNGGTEPYNAILGLGFSLHKPYIQLT